MLRINERGDGTKL